MDYFSHIDSSQQQQQQQQQNQRQQQQQKPYDLAQPHLHDAYYGYHQQRSYDAAAAASSHDQYYYHPPEHAASHHEQRPAGAQLDSSAAAGLPLDASQGIHRRGGGASVVPGGGDDPLGPYATPTGMNPAAAAAVAALSQLVETVDAAKRTGVGSLEQWQRDAVDPGMRSYVMPPPQHPHGYAVQAGGMHRGAGSRAPRRFGGRNGHVRGRGNANKAGFGQHPPRSDGRAPVRSRGRGARFARGGGRHSQRPTSEMKSDSAANESITEPESAEAQVSEAAPVRHEQPVLPVLPLAWCDICRVACNSLDILEQHKNGKRHKKTVQRLQEMQAQQKILAGSQGQPSMQGLNEKQTQSIPASQQKVVTMADGVVQEAKVDNIAQAGEQITASCISGNLQEALTGEDIIKPVSQVQAAVNQSDGKKRDDHDGKNHPKRKQMKFGRGGKRLKTSESMSRKQARPREQPRVCTLCNVICETQAVFDSHIAGKKHCSRMKRFQGDAVYGPLNVYIPPNQPSMYDPSGPQPLYFGLQTPGMVPLPGYEPQHAFPQQEHGGQAISMPQIEHLQEQNTYSTSEAGMDTAGSAPGHDVTQAELALAPTMDSEAVVETGSETEGDILEAAEGITTEDAGAKAETSSNSGEDAPAPDYGIASAGNVIPGLDIKVQESILKNETGNQDNSY